VPDVVTQQEAFLVAPEDPAALADAIRSVHSEHSDAQRRAAAAATRLERNYRIGPWLDQYEDVYRRMLAPKL
jgi:glycosyltransferase involved in cell wall biosynthesis